MNIWAIVPAKPLNRAKSRLAGVLSPEQREALSRHMLERTLVILKQVASIKGIMLVSRDTSALAIARHHGAHTLTESGAPDLNKSLHRATQAVIAAQANGVLIIASDIPLLQSNDIEGMLLLGKYAPVVVIATDRRAEGTNAMLVRPPGLVPYTYGADSAHKHLAAGRESGAEVKLYHSDTISLDVDVPADLDLYRERLADLPAEQSPWPLSL